jgi:hypothetical protein
MGIIFLERTTFLCKTVQIGMPTHVALDQAAGTLNTWANQNRAIYSMQREAGDSSTAGGETSDIPLKPAKGTGEITEMEMHMS